MFLRLPGAQPCFGRLTHPPSPPAGGFGVSATPSAGLAQGMTFRWEKGRGTRINVRAARVFPKTLTSAPKVRAQEQSKVRRRRGQTGIPRAGVIDKRSWGLCARRRAPRNTSDPVGFGWGQANQSHTGIQSSVPCLGTLSSVQGHAVGWLHDTPHCESSTKSQTLTETTPLVALAAGGIRKGHGRRWCQKLRKQHLRRRYLLQPTIERRRFIAIQTAEASGSNTYMSCHC